MENPYSPRETYHETKRGFLRGRVQVIIICLIVMLWYLPFLIGKIYIPEELEEPNLGFAMHGSLVVLILESPSRYPSYTPHVAALWIVEIVAALLFCLAYFVKSSKFRLALIIGFILWMLINPIFMLMIGLSRIA